LYGVLYVRARDQAGGACLKEKHGGEKLWRTAPGSGLRSGLWNIVAIHEDINMITNETVLKIARLANDVHAHPAIREVASRQMFEEILRFDRRTAAEAAAWASVRRPMVMRSQAIDGRSASKCQRK
jgi:hypothetical protein